MLSCIPVFITPLSYCSVLFDASVLQVSKVCSGLEQHMFGVYDQQSKVMQDKLSDLFSTLDRISVLETELEQFKTALSSLYQEMN